MLTQQVLKKVISFVLPFAIVLSLLNPLGFPVSTAYAAEGDELGLFEVKVNKPVNAAVDVPNTAIGISLPYGTSYQMLNVTTNPGVTATVYRSDELTAIPFATSGINRGDAKLDQFSPAGTSLYYLVLTDKNDSGSSRKYTVTVTVEKDLPPSIAGSVGPNDKYSPLNIKAGEHAWDVLGASKIGFGSTTGSIEGPGKASSYSGKDWYESVYDRSGDYPAAQTVPDSWLGDNMYLQTMGKSDVNALTKYGIETSAGLGKLGNDILRFHEFLPFQTPDGVSRDDGDRGAVGSDRQRLEIKSNTGSSNIDANSVGGDIMTHHWKLMLPSETLKYQMDTAEKKAGDLIAPRRFFHIFQLKAIEGDEAGQPVTTLTVVSVGGKGHLEFRNNPDGQAADRIKPLFTIPLEQVVDRWLDMEVTILTADKGYVYGKLVDVESNAVLASGGMTAETLRRPEVLNPETGKRERVDLPAVPGQQNRSKWGLYRGMYNTVNESVYGDEFQAATMYLSDIYLIKRDNSTYVFPDGWDPNSQTKDIVAWARPTVVSESPGTAFDSLGLPSQLDVTLSTGKIEKADVTWSPEGYHPNVTGTYRIYGQFTGTGLTNSKNIKPYIDVNISGIKNWAVVPGAEIKVVSQSGGSKNYFIDDKSDTSWQAHSTLAKTAGYQYWAAVKLEKKIQVSRIQLEWTSNSKFLKNFQLYYSNDAAAYDELKEGGSLSETSEATRKPHETEHGSSWIMIPGAGKATALSNNEKADLTLADTVDAQYVLLVADLTLDSNAGGIKSNVFNIIGQASRPHAELPVIVSITPESIITTAGTAPMMPTVVTAVYSDSSTQRLPVVWDSISPSQYAIAGNFAVNGTVTGTTYKALANVIVTPGTITLPDEGNGSEDSAGTPISSGPVAESAPAPTPSGGSSGNPGSIHLEQDAKVTKETAADGRTITKVAVDAEKLEKALAHPVVVIEVKGNDPAIHVELPGNAILQAMNRRSSLVIRSNGISYELPVTLFTQIQKDSTVGVSISKVSGKAGDDVNAAVNHLNAKQVISNPIEFTITVNGTEITDFGGIYVNRTITLDKVAVDPDKLTAVWIDSNNQLHFVPAVVTTKDGTSEIKIRSPHNSVYTVIQSENSFSDVAGHWAQTEIELLANKWILNGITDQQFAPEARVTRAEFAAMLVRSLGLVESKDNAFADVQSADWFAGAVGSAYKAGLINGYEDGSFKPNAVITREQMVAMMIRAMKVGGKEAPADSSVLNKFIDRSNIGEWSKAAVSQALAAGLVQGMSDTVFAANEPATRAQAAVILKRVLQSLQFIN
ncbi:S-layer homology domain-containing protein [Paenibacillus silviterrae]|uniref:S-layer homology domain-containing protein n=1 Tax=Paenibacillus silviterrae TaxID=3242194 RepID=UPI002542B259|nr:S-layer homology domain-containing protein [Paenibacillus chinjuensis]